MKGYQFLSFAKNMGKNIGKCISKNLSGKYSQKLLDHVKKSAIDAIKTASKNEIQKTAEAMGNLTGIEIAHEITKVSKGSLQVNSESETEIPKKDIYPQKKNNKLLGNYDNVII